MACLVVVSSRSTLEHGLEFKAIGNGAVLQDDGDTRSHIPSLVLVVCFSDSLFVRDLDILANPAVFVEYGILNDAVGTCVQPNPARESDEY